MAQSVSPVLPGEPQQPNETLFDFGESSCLPIPVLVLSPAPPEDGAEQRPGVGLTRWKFTPSELAEVVKSGGEFYIAFISGVVPALRVIGTKPILHAKESYIDLRIPDEDAALFGMADSMDGEKGGDASGDRGGGPKEGTMRGDSPAL